MHVFATDKPDSPGQPEVTDVDEESVTLSWTKPRSDGGSRINGYVVEVRETGTNKWKPVNEKFPTKDTNYTGESDLKAVVMLPLSLYQRQL